jgi:hypothetical protein
MKAISYKFDQSYAGYWSVTRLQIIMVGAATASMTSARKKNATAGVNGRAGNRNELIGEIGIVMGNMMETRSKNARALV